MRFLKIDPYMWAKSVGEGTTFRFGLSPKSRNAKCAGMAVSRHSSNTCPPTCPFKLDGTCYGNAGPCLWAWRGIDSVPGKGMSFASCLTALRALPPGLPFRGCETGDQIPISPGIIDRSKLVRIAEALGDRPAWSFTHYGCSGDTEAAWQNRRSVEAAVERGYVVRVSTESPAEARMLRDAYNLPVALVVPSCYHRKTRLEKRKVLWAETMSAYKARVSSLPLLPGGPEGLCPAAYCDTKCLSCRKCTLNDIRTFPAHGAGVKKIDNRLKGAM